MRRQQNRRLAGFRGADGRSVNFLGACGSRAIPDFFGGPIGPADFEFEFFFEKCRILGPSCGPGAVHPKCGSGTENPGYLEIGWELALEADKSPKTVFNWLFGAGVALSRVAPENFPDPILDGHRVHGVHIGAPRGGAKNIFSDSAKIWSVNLPGPPKSKNTGNF